VNKRTYDYKANYSKYLILRQERQDQQESLVKNQQKLIDHTEALIDKYRAKANKASFAQSLIKKLDRMERIEVEDGDNTVMNMRFPKPALSGKIVLTVEDAAKTYGDKLIFKDANFIVTKGEKIALVGRNGEGKSTMMKMIGGKTKFDGMVNIGHNVLAGVFEQDQEEKLDQNKTVFETIDELAVGDIRKQVRNILGSFLFGGDDIDKKVRVLSGGERGRLALCKLLLEPYNLLLLDEPTNHLDIRSKEILKKALLDYEGTVILVSHDRDFLDGLTSRLFEFRDGGVKEHLCDIKEFMKKRKLEKLMELKSGPVQPAAEKKVVEKPKVDTSEKDKELKQIKNQISKCEAAIEQLETDIKKLDEQLSDPDTYQKLMNDKVFFENYNQRKKKLETLLKEWESLNEKI
ncbi:MAG: ATP-binding cassette domain-containing protein, partial [Bacteroidia bacterium]